MVFAYFDTCVWLSALISKDSKHATALSVFDEAKDGNYTILVSHHVLCEILDVLKDKLVTHQKVRVSPSRETLEQLVKEKYQEFSAMLLSLTNVRIKNPNASTHQILRPCFSLLYKYFGSVVQDNKCPVCGASYNFIDCDTVYEKDILHALLAWNLNCDIFVTFDNDFRPLASEESLTPMTIRVL